MEKRTLNVAAVQIEAHKLSLLTAPDPQLKGGLRVPLGEGNDIDYSAADWTHAWEYGSTEFSDDYARQHHGQQPPLEDLKKIGQYLYVNKCDPMSPANWERAYERLQAAGVIFDPTPWSDIANAFPDKPVEPQ